MRYVNPLTAEERTTLKEGSRNGKKPHFRDRCKSILMSADGYKVSEIARLFKVRTRTIYTWFNRWEQFGISGLMILPGRGIKAPLDNADQQQVEQIREAIKANPQNLNQVCQELSQILGFTVTQNMLKRFIKKNLVTVGDDSVSV